ncbi:serine/threonine-protein kinase [Glycomyces xiaoerkulensis]|uniref:serine/threonine-protein kinase n=1 Tax=Glycomyces xiaoerkulensis TaxID=2038139 RepID=UPI0012FFE7B7|nr:serine/threonine-protein kinase [Glycomyces xiaoerkulensis]
MPASTPAIPGYRDFEIIAHGSTALVYRALQERLNRTVAIKVLLVDDEVTTTASVEKELATTVRVSGHPHIVSIIDTGTTGDDRPYIVMEHCDGGSYSTILKTHGPLAIDDTVDVGIKIGQALHAAHNAGILHRDVKPQNLLRGQYGPALADFGIARAPETLATTKAIDMLTPLHASPEALLRQPQTPASDLYSLASTMWQLLAGHAPFADPEGGTDPGLHRERVTAPTPPPPLPRDDAPTWLQDLLNRALARDPAQRPDSCQAFAESLQMGALTGRLDADDTERTVVLPPEATAPAPQGPARDGTTEPNAPFPSNRTEPTVPFAPQPAPPGAAPTPRRRPRPTLYPTLITAAIAVVALLGGLGIAWAVADRDQPGTTTGDPQTEAEAEAESEPAADAGAGSGAPAEPIAITGIDATASSLTVRTDAEPDARRCTLIIDAPGLEVAGDCAELTATGLHASTAYDLTLEPHDAEQDPLEDTAATETVTGTVDWDCPLTRTYCESIDAQIGIGADPERTDTIGNTVAGDQYHLNCYVRTDTVITPRGEEADGYWDYHPGKDASDLAIRIEYDGQTGYIPFVWLVIDPDDLNSTGPLPEC